VVLRANDDGTCDVLLDREHLSNIPKDQRTIVCSTCLQEKLAFALPQLRCSGCECTIRNKSNYFLEVALQTKLCRSCYEGLNRGQKPELLADADLSAMNFEKKLWEAKEEEEADHYVQCEGKCKRWYHYICAMFPDPAQLPHDWALDDQKFVCHSCRKNSQDLKQEHTRRLLAVQSRTACDLPTCKLSDAIEAHLAEQLAKNSVIAKDVVVRVASCKKYKYKAVQKIRNRYDGYPDGFPYISKALLAFQKIEGRDVCFFAMYVQEYGANCPQPNTNRTYISYLDSVRYLQTSPPDRRTLVYHSIVNGYLKQACALGFTHAHIWVEPPKPGDEYIFHCRPVDQQHGTRPMTGSKLRSWYQAMLTRAQECGIVREFGDIQEEIIQHLTSIRDFPMFEGDFFPEHMMQQLLAENSGPPGLARKKSDLIIQEMTKQVGSKRSRFLVALLNTSKQADIEMEASSPYVSNQLVDSRHLFLQGCLSKHWQYNELRRAHYTTMMILATLGGRPT